MIGADTNVLLRLFVEDNPRQAAAARQLLESDERLSDPIVVSTVALVEVAWSLRSNFDFSKSEVLAALDSLMSDAGVVIDDREAIEAAIAAWRTGKADFADYVIGAVARDRGARRTMTFDRKAAETPAFTLLSN